MSRRGKQYEEAVARWEAAAVDDFDPRTPEADESPGESLDPVGGVSLPRAPGEGPLA